MKKFYAKVVFLLLIVSLFNCDPLKIKIEGNPNANLDSIKVPNGLTLIKKVSTEELKNIIIQTKGKYKLVHFYDSWCSFGAKYIDSLLSTESDTIKLILVSCDINTDEQIELVRKFLYSKGYTKPSYIIDLKVNLFDLKNEKNIKKFISFFYPSFNIDDFPISLIYNFENQLIFTLPRSKSVNELYPMIDNYEKSKI